MSKREVWHPAEYVRADVRAVQSLVNYAQLAVVAWNEEEMGPPPEPPSPFEVKRALDWIIEKACQTYDTNFVPNDPNGRIAAFVEGRRSVGQQIVKLSKLKPEMVPEK